MGESVRNEILTNIEEKPNAETLAAIREVAQMKSNSELYKRYSDVDKMIADILAEV